MSCSKMDLCAFCLSPVEDEQGLKCGRCDRRAYCTKDCQLADLTKPKAGEIISTSPKASGVPQGHAYWCSLLCGEQNLDWTIASVEGKGRGLLALRDLPAMYRIFVEGAQSLHQDSLDRHPGFLALSSSLPAELHHDTLTTLQALSPRERLFFQNSFPAGSGRRLMGFRLAMVNHACDANAAVLDDPEFGVLILFSLRPIAAGEEITIQYHPFNDVRAERLPLPPIRELILLSNWGVACPSTCVCKDTAIRADLVEIKRLEGMLKSLMLKGRHDTAQRQLTRLLSLSEQRLPIHLLSAVHFWAWEFYASRRRTVGLGGEHLRKVLDFNEAIFHPRNKSEVLDLKELEMNPGKYHGFGRGDS